MTGATAEVSPRQAPVWHVYPDAALLQRRVAEGIARLANQAIAAQGNFTIVLAGGTTPQAVYRLLRNIDTDWSAWCVYFGDERCVAPDHGERNSRAASDAWLSQVAIPVSRIHVIPAELGAREGARRYASTLDAAGVFDLVLLGLGEDGHTASLFPGQEWGRQHTTSPVIAVSGAPKPPEERVSMSAWRLSEAARVWFLVTGAGKRAAVEGWRRGDDIPAAAIVARNGIEVFTEECCYGEGYADA